MTLIKKIETEEMAVEMKISRIQELEMTYGLHIGEDALASAAQILQVRRRDGVLSDEMEQPVRWISKRDGAADDETCGDDQNLPKNIDAMQLVEKACKKMRQDLDSDAEETDLDWDEYRMDRAFVEVVEQRKEKFRDRRLEFPHRIEREYTKIRSKWEHFIAEWSPQLTKMRENSEKRVALLRDLRGEMVCFIKKLDLNQLLRALSGANIQLRHTIPTAFKERRVVGPSSVVEVASSLTGLFLRYFDSPFYRRPLPHEHLKTRLSEKLVMLDDVIQKITCALSKPKSNSGALFGSFLFLGGHGRGRKRLAETLAGEIYDDKGRFLKIDMSEYKEPNHHVSHLVSVLNREKKRGSVVMFENIGHCSVKLLSQILRDGRLTDENGVDVVDFSHDLILVSSHIGHEEIVLCRCLNDTSYEISFREMLKDEPELHDPKKHYSVCNLRPFYDKVKDVFEFEFMDLFNDIVIFPWMRPQDVEAIARLYIRDVATSMSTLLKKKRGAFACMTWYRTHLEPLLNDDVFKSNVDDMMIIYVDMLLGLEKQYSIRVETSRHFHKYLDVKSFKEKMWKLRKTYRREKLLVDMIYRLQKSYLHLSELIHADASSIVMELVEAVRLIDDIILHDIFESELMHVDDFNGNMMCDSKDETRRRTKTYLNRVSKRLRCSLRHGNKAIQVVIESLLSRVIASYNNDDRSKESCPRTPASFLCMGLTSLGNEQFADNLAQHLVVNDKEKLLIQVDLSHCTEPDSFFRCASDVNTHLLLVESVRKTPHYVIMFYKLETTHISVFSKILSILEFGVAEDDEGNEVYFGDSVVVIVTDLGNKEMIAGLNGHHCCYMVLRNQPVHEIEVRPTEEEVFGSSSKANEIEVKSMRCELLNLLDYMLLFYPFSDDQQNVFVKLRLKSLEKNLFYSPLLHLFRIEGDERFKRGLPYTTSELFHSITSAGGKDVIIRYTKHG
ncbi:hypothetical protein OROMI_015280 [Orobanche minor]